MTPFVARTALPALVAAFVTGCAAPPSPPSPPTPPSPPDVPTCPSQAEIADKVQRYLALQTVPMAPASLTMAGAVCGARKFVAALVPTQGQVIGYKAGLTNPAVQQRFGLTSPLKGTLLARMMLNDGATVPAHFGARPFIESDLVVEVASSDIHDARTPLDVLKSLRNVRPFIELPDALVEDPSKITAPALVANNVGARLGVLGQPLPVTADEAFANALRTMRVRTTDNTGKEIGAAPGTAVLGHPLNAVIWLAAELRKEGITLKPGDLLSLGAFGAGQAEAGRTVTVTYEGLPGNPAVRVTFR